MIGLGSLNLIANKYTKTTWPIILSVLILVVHLYYLYGRRWKNGATSTTTENWKANGQRSVLLAVIFDIPQTHIAVPY